MKKKITPQSPKNKQNNNPDDEIKEFEKRLTKIQSGIKVKANISEEWI